MITYEELLATIKPGEIKSIRDELKRRQIEIRTLKRLVKIERLFRKTS